MAAIPASYNERDIPPNTSFELEINDHLQSRWLEFSAIGRKGKRTSVRLSLNLQPVAEHPVCMARIIARKSAAIAHRFSLPDEKQLHEIRKLLKDTIAEGERLYRETMAGDAVSGKDLNTYALLADQTTELLIDRLKEVWQQKIHHHSTD